MNAARDFLLMAKDAQPQVTNKPPRITCDGQTTFWKMCTVCAEMMPHVRRDDYTECVLCGHKTHVKSQPVE